jgi:hypothetical protein
LVLLIVNAVMVAVSLLLGLWFHVGTHLILAAFGLLVYFLFKSLPKKE